MNLYLICATIICLFFLYITRRNIVTLKRWSFSPGKVNHFMVSVIVPARNEEKNIAHCLFSLLKQDYDNYEILVLDDNSEDRTWSILKDFKKKSDRIRIFPGKPLPEGWSGKQFACHQLVEKAKGEYLLFTDADTVHSSFSIRWAVHNLEKHNADFLSAYIYHIIGSLGEAVVIPAIYILTTLILPLWKLPEKNHPSISFAIGQFIFCKKSVFHAIGGYSSFKQSVVEDMDMARIMKAHGFKTIFLDAKEYVQCRMYTTFSGAYKGLAKSLFGALNQNILLLFGLLLLVSLVIEFPVLHLLHILLNGSEGLAAAVPVFIFFFTWFLMVKSRKLSLFISFLYPLVFMNIMIIAILSFLKTGYGKGMEWKGRLVKCRSPITQGDKKGETEG
ncbi:MAG: glycosyltransferase [Spirochaetales bacterium]|nr:glycosyltransferase [Spirochaetales bacterium]